MATLLAVGAELLRTGDYSDLTLVCGGQEFHVHQNIICPQSPVFKPYSAGTGDKNLRQVLAETASLKIFELMERDLFSEKKIANVWAADVLKESTKQFKTTAAKNQQLLDEIMAGKKEINSLKENLKELVDVLSTTHTCFNRECKPRFGFNIQQPLQNSTVDNDWIASLLFTLQNLRRYMPKSDMRTSNSPVN
ncbi:hypothetical protein F5B18DRAFT_649510 [Nemania serpens]|nr:hypothetical protein F5B18DRAFT_649510 [Nemania serpens]